MTNHVMSDGILAVDECKRPIRYRDKQVILQDSCTPEPRTELIIQRHDGYDNTVLPVDVLRATRLRDALDAFLQDAQGLSAWRYDGVHYDLDKAWEGRPGTGLERILFRHNDTFRDGVPVMEAVAPVTGHVVTLADVLGLQPCVMHGIYAAPCHLCIMGNVGEHLRGDETAQL